MCVIKEHADMQNFRKLPKLADKDMQQRSAWHRKVE